MSIVDTWVRGVADTLRRIRGEPTVPSYVRNVGKVSFTYQDSGAYGRFMNEGRLAAWRLALQRHSIPLARVLDVGCSYGSWAGNWRELGFAKLSGIDPNQEVAARAREVFDEVVVGWSFDVAGHFPSNALIASNGVVVHILEEAEEERFLRDLGMSLAAGGFLVFSVVNARYYLSPAGFKPWQGPNSCTRYLEEHEALAARAGLRIVDRIGTFINPWFCEDLGYIAGERDLVADWSMYEGLLQFSAALRGRALIPFSEVLLVAQRGS